ncbi:hypothetical protein [Paenibacillus cymbidii]|uniref:hypothetical protein n=1 Tax=Paenibacillus cymbidii TaxID=1639034 RepID=UPI001081367D|nr:hypothetical protein [Paenibacillus cymbidii]
MAVWVFSTGSIVKTANTPAFLRMTVNNRTTDTQNYRIIVWNTSSPDGPKTALQQFAFNIPPNNTDTLEFIIDPSANVTRYEVEYRFSNPHMVPWLFQIFATPLFETPLSEEVAAALTIVTGSIWIDETVSAGEMFADSTQNENP